MIDLVLKDNDLEIVNTSIYKGKNILETQIGYLAYAPEFGIDYDLFFGEDFNIQTATFQAYAISQLSANGVNPLDVVTSEGKFDARLNIQIDN